MNQTEEKMSSGAMNQGAAEAFKLTPENIADACEQDFRSLRERIYRLECTVSKYERIFERIFQDEAASRLGTKTGNENNAIEWTGLDRLRNERLRAGNISSQKY